jgi:hypothetical protein
MMPLTLAVGGDHDEIGGDDGSAALAFYPLFDLSMDTDQALEPNWLGKIVSRSTRMFKSTSAIRKAPGGVAPTRALMGWDAAHLPHRIIAATAPDEAESHTRLPAKIAIDFLKKQPP